MDKSLLVAVFVPTTDAEGTDFQGRSGTIATGYPVGPSHILTARHVLTPERPKVRDPRYPIRVRWHYHRSDPAADAQGWMVLAPDAEAILWPSPDCVVQPPGPDDLDALLLRAPRPATALGWRDLSPERPSTRLTWESEGFPHATKSDDRREPCAFGGTCFSKADGEPYFELAAQAPPREEEDWRGASGMPIFSGRRILGIAQRVPFRFGAERLWATPAWKLLADPGFRAALGLDERAGHLRRLGEALARDLEGDCALGLADALDAAPALLGLGPPQQAATLAGRLLETDVRTAIRCLRRAHKQVSADSGEVAAAPLLRIANRVVPALFDRGVVRQVKDQGALALVALPAATHTVAELIMAAADDRALRLRPREREDDQPAGDLSLPLVPEQGIGSDPSAALAGHLERKLNPCVAPAQALRAALDAYLLGTFYRPDPGERSLELSQRILLASDTLTRRREDTGETFYLILRPPEDPAEAEPYRAMAEQLKRDFAAIAVLELDPGFEVLRADRDLADPLCRMLPIKTRREDRTP